MNKTLFSDGQGLPNLMLAYWMFGRNNVFGHPDSLVDT